MLVKLLGQMSDFHCIADYDTAGRSLSLLGLGATIPCFRQEGSGPVGELVPLGEAWGAALLCWKPGSDRSRPGSS